MKTNIPFTTEQRKFIDWALRGNTQDLQIIDNYGATIWHDTMRGLVVSDLGRGVYVKKYSYLYNALAKKLKSTYEEHLYVERMKA